eukprot:6212980-Pleurochrysis_carterae.AAC.3
MKETCRSMQLTRRPSPSEIIARPSVAFCGSCRRAACPGNSEHVQSRWHRQRVNPWPATSRKRSRSRLTTPE